jgi:hypothetical protein
MDAIAVACYRRAIELSPGHASAHLNLGAAHAQQDIRTWKRNWTKASIDCARSTGGISSSEGPIPSFQFAHHGRNSRALKRKFAALFEPCFPERKPQVRQGKPRIGFLTTFGHEGGMLRSMAGIIERLDPARFEPLVLCSERALETCRAGIQRADVECVSFPNRFPQAVERVAAAQCDVLFHWQIGTDPINYLLPFARALGAGCHCWLVQQCLVALARQCFWCVPSREAVPRDSPRKSSSTHRR